MKPIATLLFFITLLLNLDASAQSTNLTTQSWKMTSVLYEEGWSLLDEGNYTINNDRTLILNERVYRQDKKYILVALVDDCTSCPISVRFGVKGQTPNKLKDRKANLKRFPSKELSTINFKTSPEKDTKGYLMVFSTSMIKRYAYAMLFVKDN